MLVSILVLGVTSLLDHAALQLVFVCVWLRGMAACVSHLLTHMRLPRPRVTSSEDEIYELFCEAKWDVFGEELFPYSNRNPRTVLSKEAVSKHRSSCVN